MKTTHGFIYLMFDGEHHKIGRTTDIARRLHNYRADGYDMQVVHFFGVTDMRAWERYFRFEFGAYLVKGAEWYYLPDDEVSWFEQINGAVDFLPTDKKAMDTIRPIRYDRSGNPLSPPRHSLEVGYWADIRARDNRLKRRWGWIR